MMGMPFSEACDCSKRDERWQCPQRESQHSQCSCQWVSCAQHIDLQCLGESAGEEERRGAEKHGSAVILAVARVIYLMGDEFRHLRRQSSQSWEKFEELQSKKDHDHARYYGQDSVRFRRE